MNPGGRCLILDNHPIFGGEAKRNEFLVDGHRLIGPQGSNDFGVQAETGGPDDYFTSLGIPREYEYREPEGAASGMKIPFDNYGFLHWQHDLFSVGHFFDDGGGRWVKDLWRSGLDHSPWSSAVRDSFRGVREEEAEGHARGDIGPWLDSMTMKQYYEGVLGLPPAVTAYVDPILASIIGLGCDAISAWWGLHFELPGFRKPDRYAGFTFHCFPGGNAGLARYFMKDVIPEGIEGSGDLADVLNGAVAFDRLDRPEQPVRVRLGSTAVRVEHRGALSSSERGVITYLKDEQVHQLRARSVVMASGGWVNRRVLRDLPDGHRRAYEGFNHSSVLVANVALTNLGDAGFDPANDIAGIILNRWGHAYVNPGPGFMFGRNGAPAPPDVIREPFGRIAIGHSELRGHQNWTGAAGEGRRAVEALLA